ncbi:MAG: twin-arginine translocase TatA/TatE family subunit [Anaerolineaceae bacterium]|jgi:sec-independent protein translocase protein TatA|nr:twin-arginine translocase TatA/TatE family subunit [Anaerolineaceae bacterium]OQY91346.1 MAG: hypothetical protein B6D38_01715 [Anaerolineae bacterium UTCFX1]
MPGLPRGAEWIVILVIVILLFGPGRIGKVAGELGKGIRSFREGLSEGKQAEDSDDSSEDKESK